MLPGEADGSLGILARLLAAAMLAGVVGGAVLVPHVLVEPKSPGQGLALTPPRVTAPPVAVTVPAHVPAKHGVPRKTGPVHSVTRITPVVPWMMIWLWSGRTFHES